MGPEAMVEYWDLQRDVAQHLVGAVVVALLVTPLLVETLHGAALAAVEEEVRLLVLREPPHTVAQVPLEQQEPQLLPLQRRPVAVREARTTPT
jgi:hypothetical protein